MRPAMLLLLAGAWAATLPQLAACQAMSKAAPNSLTAEERSAGWQLLFDGRTTQGWRGYLQKEMPAGWQVVDGALTRVAPASDIITEGKFDSFELSLEWKVAPGGNSGIFFNVVEDPSLQYAYLSGPEYQILDNQAHRDGLDPRTSAGSNYALHAPVRDATRKPGEWNEARIIVNGSHVEHWLNGVKLLEYELWSDDWKQRVQNSKFKEMPRYGQAREGHIALQDHGDLVSYRNIKVRSLSAR